MVLSLAATLALAAACAPSVAPETLLAIVQVESGLDHLAIGVNGSPKVTVIPRDLNDAVRQASALIADGRSVDLGLAQINNKNLARLGLSLAEVFEPCTNLRAAARILQDGYVRSDAIRVGEQAALKTALSYYNTGHPVRGFSNGYVGKVTSAAGRIAPAIVGVSLVNVPGAEPDAPPEAPPPAWYVFGEAHRGRGSFVTTVFITASGGSQ